MPRYAESYLNRFSHNFKRNLFDTYQPFVFHHHRIALILAVNLVNLAFNILKANYKRFSLTVILINLVVAKF